MMYLAKLKTLAATFASILFLIAGAFSVSFFLLHHEAVAHAASSEPAAPQTAAEQRAAFLAPFLHDNTLLVAHFDIYRIDLKASANAFKNNPTLRKGQFAAQNLQPILAAADDFLTRFKQAGGRHIYLLMPPPAPNTSAGPVLLFPLETGMQGAEADDPQLLAKVISSLPGLPQITQFNDHLLVCCDPAALALLKTPAAPAPQLQQALLETNGGIQVAIAPNDATRTFLNSNPKTTQLRTLINSLQYLTLSVNLPTSGEIKLVGQCDTEDHAVAAAQEWNGFLAQTLASMSNILSANDLATIKKLSLVTANGKSITLTLQDNLETASAFLALAVALNKMNASAAQPASTQEK